LGAAMWEITCGVFRKSSPCKLPLFIIYSTFFYRSLFSGLCAVVFWLCANISEERTSFRLK
jgi:hypothetical protein